jgi:hypothetical protein
VEATRGGPYVTAVSVTAEPEAKLIDPKPATAHAPWIRPIADYDRRMTSEVHGTRYG